MLNKLLIILLIVFATTSKLAAQSKLETSKDEVRAGEQTEKLSTSDNIITEQKHSGGSGSSMFDDEFSDNILADILMKAFAAVVYYTAVGSYGTEYHLHNNIAKHPYISNNAGNYTTTYSQSETVKKVRVDADNTLMFGSGMYGNHLNVRFRPCKYIYLNADYRELIEPKPNESGVENLSLFHATVCYDRLRFPVFNIGYNLGVDYLASGVNKLGFTYGFKLESFAIQKVSLFSEFMWSKINARNVNTIELKASYHLQQWKISMGYEHMRISNPTYNFFTVGGGFYF